MQPDRYKSKEDTWSTEELKKHLKTMQSDSGNDRRNKVRSHHREDDEHTRRKHRPDEKGVERAQPNYQGRDGHTEKGKGEHQEQRKEKEKAREGDQDKHRVSERHRTKDREKTSDKMDTGEEPIKEYGTYDLGREERKMRDSHVLEKSKHRNEDRERRHKERREKEGRKRESEEHEDRKQRHRKASEVLTSRDVDRERRRSDRRHSEVSDREKRHHSRQEKGTPSDQRTHEDPVLWSDRAKEKPSTEGYIHGDKEQRHRDKKDRRTRAHERTKTDSQEIDADTAYDESTNYEEDFEDYDDDFEDGSEEEKTADKTLEPKEISKNPEVEEIQKAMLLENDSVTTILSAYRHKAHDLQDDDPSTEGRSSTPRRSSQRGTFIDFGSAKKRQVSGQISNKQKIRSLEILRLVDLDFSSTFSLLDLPPVKEYEMYIRNFGKTNTKQAYVQCNEDAVDREIQTEEIDFEEKWTQHPGEGTVVCGGHRNDAVQNVGVVTKVDTQRLTMFLRSACQVVTILLEEDRAEKQSNYKVQSKDPCLAISESCFHLNSNLAFLQGRSVYLLQFSEAQRHLLLTLHGLDTSTTSTSVWEKYIICVWNIWQPSTPQKILICQSEVKCCCFSPGLASLVFAGTSEGSVLVWDLREDLSIHQTMVIEDTNWTFRSPTFSTDGVFIQVSHTHPVTAVEPVPSTETKGHGISFFEDMSGLSFQVASLDESGHLILWVVVELRKADLAGSQSDLGLIPGGKVKLIHSSSKHLSDKLFHKDVLMLGSPQALNIKFLPKDFNHFVIGTDIGLVTHGTQYGLIEPPMQYRSMHSKLRPSQVTAIDFSPFGAAAFLAGCSDGCIRLHTMSTAFPAVQWDDSTNGHSVTALQWSLTRPTVFFVLDAASSMYIWDLSQNYLHPMARESIMPDRVLSMSVFGEPEKNNLMGLALGKSSGKVEIHYIKKKIAKSQPQELETLHLILQEIYNLP